MIHPKYIQAIGLALDAEFWIGGPSRFDDGKLTMSGDYSVSAIAETVLRVLDENKICGNGSATHKGVGCGQLFKNGDVTATHQYKQTYYWCHGCYQKIKGDE